MSEASVDRLDTSFGFLFHIFRINLHADIG